MTVWSIKDVNNGIYTSNIYLDDGERIEEIFSKKHFIICKTTKQTINCKKTRVYQLPINIHSINYLNSILKKNQSKFQNVKKLQDKLSTIAKNKVLNNNKT